jgi:cobalt-precorrin 5A hydrolase/precorrin-3B C17-methyltransferase
MMEKLLWVGIGCQQGVSLLEIDSAIEWVFTEHNLDRAKIAGIATLDRRAAALELVDYCRVQGWFLKIYRPEWLNSVNVPRSSAVVAAIIGSGSVAEAAAICAAQTEMLLVPKQKFRLDPESGWVTIAVGQENLV